MLKCVNKFGSHQDLNSENRQDQLSLLLELYTVREDWHIAHFWVSYGRCAMPGLPMGRSEGLSW